MIEFSLDDRSGVSPYLQVVHQVRQALRLGLLREGDQLPTVKDVVAGLAINPNTVLKAYRELEREGLVAARPGVGTFVTRTLADSSLAAHEPLRRDLGRWLAKARAGRAWTTRASRRCSRAPFAPCTRRSRERHRARPSGLGKRYRRRWALRDCTLEIPAGRVTGLVGPNGAGKTTLLSLAVGLLDSDDRDDRGVRRPAGADAAQLAKVGFVAQDTPTYAGLTRRRPPARSARTSTRAGTTTGRPAPASSGSASTRRRRPASSPAGSAPSSHSTLGLAKRPELLILDEPVASLDPLARREFLQVLMEAVAEHEVSVVLSSHVVSDLERVCDHLVVLVDSQVRVAGDVDDAARHAPPADRPAARPRHAAGRPAGGAGPATPTGSRRSSCAPTRRCSTRPGRSADWPRGPRAGLHGPGTADRDLASPALEVLR